MRLDIEWWLHCLWIFNGHTQIMDSRPFTPICINSCTIARTDTFGNMIVYIPWGNGFFWYPSVRNELLENRWSTELYSLSVSKQLIPRYCSSRYEAPLASLGFLHSVSGDSEKNSKYCRLLSNISRFRNYKIKQLKLCTIKLLYLNS